MRTWPLVAAGVLTASAAQAQDVRLTPLIDTRLRWERVDQDGVASPADAVTVRVRSGVKAETGPFEALIETEATLAIIGRYNSGSNGRTSYPLVVDPEDIELIARSYATGPAKSPRLRVASCSNSPISASSARPASARTSRPSMPRGSSWATPGACSPT